MKIIGFKTQFDKKPKSDKLKVIRFIIQYCQYVVLTILTGVALNLAATYLFLTPGQIQYSVLIFFVQHNSVIASVLLVSFGLLPLLNYAIFRSTHPKIIRLRQISLAADYDFISGTSARLDRKFSTGTDVERKLQVGLVKGWIQNDTKFKEDLKPLFVSDDNNGIPALSEAIKTIQHLKEENVLLEKQLLEEKAKKKSWRDVIPNWASTMYNIVYILVAIPTLVTLIYELYKLYHP